MRISRAAQVALSSLFALALYGAAACSSDTTTSVDTNAVVGVYTLTTVDGLALPAPAKDPVTGVVLGTYTAGSATLTAAKTFTFSLSYTLANGTTGSLPGAGTYSVSGSTVTFIEANVTATFSGGNTLTATLSNQVFVFKK
jgi:hypothetical protein